jgi:hypothetical protein
MEATVAIEGQRHQTEADLYLALKVAILEMGQCPVMAQFCRAAS